MSRLHWLSHCIIFIYYYVQQPCGTDAFKKLPMGLCNSRDIFEEKMNEQFNGFKYAGT